MQYVQSASDVGCSEQRGGPASSAAVRDDLCVALFRAHQPKAIVAVQSVWLYQMREMLLTTLRRRTRTADAKGCGEKMRLEPVAKRRSHCMWRIDEEIQASLIFSWCANHCLLGYMCPCCHALASTNGACRSPVSRHDRGWGAPRTV